ncbi:hypothetical protein J3E69DRAFT_324553 [Trichoderma sp. SZMC 28015]
MLLVSLFSLTSLTAVTHNCCRTFFALVRMTMAIRVPTYFRVCAPFEYQGKDRDAVQSGEWVRVPAVERPPWMASIGLWLSPPG